jgi:glycosyltransferase involved in cell wall biosynthesis
MTNTKPKHDPQQAFLSVMIPNFNYARMIGETIDSVLVQAASDVEIVVCDNASTDDSAEVVKGYGERVRLQVNPCNVGFAANLERVATMATGRRMLLLSSDDRMRPGAIDAYRRLDEALGERAERAVWGSASTIIDGNGKVTGHDDPDPKLWRGAQEEPELSKAVGHRVRSMPAAQLLRRSLEMLRTPFLFLATCYPKALHDEVGGYSGGRLINPDKWFAWKLLSVAETAYTIDHELFDYRKYETGGQLLLQERSGALKHLTDEYVATFNLPDSVLTRAGLDRQALAEAFVEQDIALRGLVSLAEGRRRMAKRTVSFGLAAYPEQVRSNPKVWALRALLSLGPVGTGVARALRTRAEARWKSRESALTDSR